MASFLVYNCTTNEYKNTTPEELSTELGGGLMVDFQVNEDLHVFMRGYADDTDEEVYVDFDSDIYYVRTGDDIDTFTNITPADVQVLSERFSFEELPAGA